ncbi:hypothetical protein PR002_g23147 [Phytophthora rubi]|uniref:Uncharacterized protein n=2 Tax=Phytophthora rubi TaxID=129364 RepID=A0A6A3INY5_9STRA|nr:hypothetical protein PR002_g23147 [Phytophthora rubi]
MGVVESPPELHLLEERRLGLVVVHEQRLDALPHVPLVTAPYEPQPSCSLLSKSTSSLEMNHSGTGGTSALDVFVILLKVLFIMASVVSEFYSFLCVISNLSMATLRDTY